MQRSECVLQGADSASKLHQKDADSYTTLTGRSVHTSWEYVEYNRLPAFLHDNEFLMRRHRPQLNSVAECLKSAFMLHSETWNIWTHVFGMVCLITSQQLVLCMLHWISTWFAYAVKSVYLHRKLIGVHLLPPIAIKVSYTRLPSVGFRS